MKGIQQNPHIIESSDCLMNMLRVIDLSLIWLNGYCGIYSIPKESKKTAVFLSINNKTQFVLFILSHLLF